MGTNYRASISKKNKYWISKHRFYEIQHMCYQYQEWKDEYRTLSEQGISAVVVDDMPHSTDVGNPTEAKGMRLAELARKIALVEETAIEADPDLAKYILKAVTDENVTFNYLQQVMNIPCGKDMYYSKRRRFYWLMSRRM